MIASFNIMVKTFAKIAQTFVGLLATIVAIRKKHVLIFCLEAKYAKMNCKNEIYAKNWVRSIWTEKIKPDKKVNGQPFEKSTINAKKVNPRISQWLLLTMT